MTNALEGKLDHKTSTQMYSKIHLIALVVPMRLTETITHMKTITISRLIYVKWKELRVTQN